MIVGFGTIYLNDLNSITLSKFNPPVFNSDTAKKQDDLPVKTAEEKLILENKSTFDKINAIAEYIKSARGIKGAEIMLTHSDNLNKSLTSLFDYKKWSDSEPALINFITKNPTQKGFKSSIAFLKQDEWSELYKFLKTQL